MKVKELLALFPEATPDGSAWFAPCPSHEDSGRSLQITTDPRGTIFLRCAKRCSIQELTKSLGIKIRDLFPESSNKRPTTRRQPRKRSLCPAPPLTHEPRILDAFKEALRESGLAGEERAACLLFLILLTRFLGTLVSAFLKGPSSAGKSRTLKTVLKFVPPSAYYELTAMTPKVLAYDDTSIAHKFIVLYEATALKGSDGAYLMRSLLSEGQVRYKTVEKENERLVAREIVREGPTGLLSTTTEVSLDVELETRCLSIPVNDSPEQTRNILLMSAQLTNQEK